MPDPAPSFREVWRGSMPVPGRRENRRFLERGIAVLLGGSSPEAGELAVHRFLMRYWEIYRQRHRRHGWVRAVLVDHEPLDEAHGAGSYLRRLRCVADERFEAGVLSWALAVSAPRALGHWLSTYRLVYACLAGADARAENAWACDDPAAAKRYRSWLYRPEGRGLGGPEPQGAFGSMIGDAVFRRESLAILACLLPLEGSYDAARGAALGAKVLEQWEEREGAIAIGTP